MESQGVVVWALLSALFISNLIAIGNIGDAGRRRICATILGAIVLIYMIYEAIA